MQESRKFLALLDFRAEAGDEIIAKHLRECARNATYTSATIKNNIIEITMKYLRNKLISEIQEQQLTIRIMNSFAYQFDLSMILVAYMKNFLDLYVWDGRQVQLWQHQSLRRSRPGH